jgi:hypothetical protein
MAILRVNIGTFDPARIPQDRINRVVRLRMKDVVHGLLDPASTVTSLVERERLRRYVTVLSALLGESIPASFVLIDQETKQLFFAVRQQLKLVKVNMMPLGFPHGNQEIIPYHVNNLEWSEELDQQRKAVIKTYAGVDHLVQSEFLKMLAKNEYLFFHIFATRCRQRMTAAQKAVMNDEGIQSIITAYAARTGLQIPQGYVRYDSVSILLMNWDNLPQQTAQVFHFREKFIPRASCNCGNCTGDYMLGMRCNICYGTVQSPEPEKLPDLDQAVFTKKT